MKPRGAISNHELMGSQLVIHEQTSDPTNCRSKTADHPSYSYTPLRQSALSKRSALIGICQKTREGTGREKERIMVLLIIRDRSSPDDEDAAKEKCPSRKRKGVARVRLGPDALESVEQTSVTFALT